MFRSLKLSLLPASVAFLMASDPGWNLKSTDQWTDDDAKQVLVASGWVKTTAPLLVYQPTEDQLRQGGQMGGGKSAGIDSLDPANLLGIKHRSAKPSKTGTLLVRWESAAPIRAAEDRLKKEDAPDWDGEYYAVAVVGVPLAAGLDLATQTELKRSAVLRRRGKKDLKAARVEVEQSGKGQATVLYLFPRSTANESEPIGVKDKRVEFSTILGRLSIAQFFYPSEMLFQGKLAL